VLERAWITHDEVVNGGELVLRMSPEPTEWGSKQLP
jgi:putative alpha-1,2-mannosidase